MIISILIFLIVCLVGICSYLVYKNIKKKKPVVVDKCYKNNEIIASHDKTSDYTPDPDIKCCDGLKKIDYETGVHNQLVTTCQKNVKKCYKNDETIASFQNDMKYIPDPNMSTKCCAGTIPEYIKDGNRTDIKCKFT